MAVREHGFEGAATQAVGTRVQEPGALLALAGRKGDSEPGHPDLNRFPTFGENGRHLLGRRHIRIVVEVKPLLRKYARNLASIPDASESIAHDSNLELPA